MRPSKFLFVAVSALGLLASQNASARIGVLSPWSFQDREAVKRGEISQSAGMLFGYNGVSPTGADANTNFFSVPYQISFGMQDKFEVGARWGLAWTDREESDSQLGVPDLAVAARYRFFDPNRSERVPGLDTEFGFTFPTGSYEKGLGTGGLGVLFGWGLVLPLDPVRAHVGMEYKLNTENSDDVRVGHVFSYNAGASCPLRDMKEDVSATLEIKGMSHAKNTVSGTKVGTTADELYFVPGAIWKFKDGISLEGSILIGLTSASSNFGANIELRF